MPSRRSSAQRLLALAATCLIGAVLTPAGPTGAQDASPSASRSATVPVGSPAAGSSRLGGSWRRMARAPFGAVGVAGGWTGQELVVVDPDQKRRAAAYDPATDRWREIARPPWKIDPYSPAHWTGTELVFVERRGAAKRGLAAYDPGTDRWRRAATSPINEIVTSVGTDAAVVVASAAGRVAAYDPATDSWHELPIMPRPSGSAVSLPAAISLYWTGQRLLALTSVPGDPEAALAFVPLDLEHRSWGPPSPGPLSALSSSPVWTGESFVFLAAAPDPGDAAVGGVASALYEPSTDTWTSIENPCGFDTTDAVWSGELIIEPRAGLAYDPTTGACSTLAERARVERSRALRVWTGSDVLEWSGNTGEASRPRRDGIAYRPPWVSRWVPVHDKPSRPVRIRVPSLGIDLPVISTERRVKGGSPGYPACDVALYWTVFDLPGAPGTTWILAHAQEGMFLPLLETVRESGARSLVGRRVEMQLRDGRVLTYRTYRVKPRADTSDLSIARKGRRDDEQRLVLQTSTGAGSDPKLQVAARLVEASRTDEPRPRPRPRACG